MSTRAELLAVRALLRNDFFFFLMRVFQTLYPGKTFVDAPHVRIICDRLQRIDGGEINRLLIAIPPRYLKSTIVSVAYTAWRLAHDPSLRIVVVSYSLDLASKLSREFRAVIAQDWFKKAFPQFRTLRNTELAVDTVGGGYRKAVSIEASITGFGADLIIGDDPIKVDDAKNSPRIRATVREYIDETLFPRLDNKETGTIIFLQQRIHREDPIGHLLEKNIYDTLILPAIAEQDERYEMVDGELFERKKGDALCSEIDSLSKLASIRSELGHAAFQAQYQQDPLLVGAGRFEWSWFKTYDQPLDRRRY